MAKNQHFIISSFWFVMGYNSTLMIWFSEVIKSQLHFSFFFFLIARFIGSYMVFNICRSETVKLLRRRYGFVTWAQVNTDFCIRIIERLMIVSLLMYDSMVLCQIFLFTSYCHSYFSTEENNIIRTKMMKSVWGTDKHLYICEEGEGDNT